MAIDNEDVRVALNRFHERPSRIFSGPVFDINKNINKTTALAYQFTNEPLDVIFKDLDFKDKRVASVGSSGDQLLFAAYNGAKDLTLIDGGIYAEFVVDLKISAIRNLDYMDFMEYWDNGYLVDENIYPKLSKDLSEKSKLFWDTLYKEFQAGYDCDYQNPQTFFKNRIFHRYGNTFSGHFCEMYRNEENFNKLKKMLTDCKFRYIKCDFGEFPKKLDGKYDYIFLSNVYDYFNNVLRDTKVGEDETKFFTTLNKMYENNLSRGGKIQIEYNFQKFLYKQSPFSNINKIDIDMIRFLPNGSVVEKLRSHGVKENISKNQYLKKHSYKDLMEDEGINFFLCKDYEFEKEDE